MESLLGDKLQQQTNRFQDRNFIFHGQYPIIERGVILDPIMLAKPTSGDTGATVLAPNASLLVDNGSEHELDDGEDTKPVSGEPSPIIPPDMSETDDDDSASEFDDSDDEIVSEAEASPVGSRGGAFHRGKTPPNTSSLRRSGRAPVPRAIFQPATPPRKVKAPSKKVGTDCSKAAKRSLHRFFLLDYAVASVVRAPPDAMPPLKDLMGFKDIEAADCYLPIVVEVKAAIKRTADPELNPGGFGDNIRYRLDQGLDDIVRKRKAAFEKHPSQVSFVGICISGPWWAFTLVNDTTSELKLSEAFVCGSISHNSILSKIFDAAVKSPIDPCAYEKGILVSEFKRFSAKRVRFAPLAH